MHRLAQITDYSAPDTATGEIDVVIVEAALRRTAFLFDSVRHKTHQAQGTGIWAFYYNH